MAADPKSVLCTPYRCTHAITLFACSGETGFPRSPGIYQRLWKVISTTTKGAARSQPSRRPRVDLAHLDPLQPSRSSSETAYRVFAVLFGQALPVRATPSQCLPGPNSLEQRGGNSAACKHSGWHQHGAILAAVACRLLAGAHRWSTPACQLCNAAAGTRRQQMAKRLETSAGTQEG